MSVKKMLNKYVNDIQAYVIRNKHLIGYPARICIDTTNFCQLSCPLCPTGEKKASNSKKIMKYEDYLKIINEIGDYLYKITFYNWGEPLFNKDLHLFIKEATRRGIRSHISTNLNYYNDEIIEQLVESGLYKITIGIDGASPEVYKTYRKNGDFNKVIEGIKKINEEKKKRNSNYPKLVWQFIVMKHNEHEIEAARKLAEELNMKFRLKAVSLDEQDKELMEKWYPENSLFRKYDYNKKNKQPYIDRCLELWNSPVIDSEGNMYSCCYVFGEKYKAGNIIENSFRSTWNNKIMKESRESVMKKDKSRFSNTQCSQCDQCKTRRSLSEFFKAISKRGTARRGIVGEGGKKSEHNDWYMFNGGN